MSQLFLWGQRFLQYRSGVPNTPDGGISTMLFIMNRWLGKIATSLFVSLIVLTTKGLQLIIVLTSVNKVFRDSSSKLLVWVLRRDNKMLLADLIYLSQTPLMWLAKSIFLFQPIQSAFWLSINLWILLWFISSICQFSLHNNKITPIITLDNSYIMPLRAIKQLRASMNESVFMPFVISMCTAWLIKQENSTP